ncbi:alpha/beta fold hydrolase [Shouchella lehensis]|uniref:Alpha/beta hydrolase n=1 Tax=Shouchella lehensis G1 TaxID=1246626 RepID=A0A060LZT5_9BACI|nr:alpha/beta hydrolase [Shouchella lehensis]AIC93329.1 alpha/beta hydrolase [Shouchella lehensis G1]
MSTSVLAFQEVGDPLQPLLFFIHGGGVSSWMWEKQLTTFSSTYHCLAVDLPEHGKSKGQFSIGQSALKCLQLAKEKAEGKPIHLIGFSLGAQVVIDMISKDPNVAETAMINSALVNTTSFVRTGGLLALQASYPLAKYRTFAKAQANVLYIPEEQFDRYYEESKQLKRDTLVRVMRENLSYQLPSSFSSVKTKMLVTVGEKENRMMKRSLTEIKYTNEYCQDQVFTGVGHGYSLADPHGFNTVLLNWVTGERW